MRSAHDVIVAPLITEKTTLLKEKGPVLAFRVDRRANKVEIRQAVETLFKVKVAHVRTQNAWGKRKRVGSLPEQLAQARAAAATAAVYPDAPRLRPRPPHCRRARAHLRVPGQPGPARRLPGGDRGRHAVRLPG